MKIMKLGNINLGLQKYLKRKTLAQGMLDLALLTGK